MKLRGSGVLRLHTVLLGLLVAAAACAAGCLGGDGSGAVQSRPADAGDGGGPGHSGADSAQPPGPAEDAGRPGDGAGEDQGAAHPDATVAADTDAPPCLADSCGPHEECTPTGCRCLPGYEPAGGQCVPEDPCAGVRCEANSTCAGGRCVCDPGWEDDGQGGCKPRDPCAELECPAQSRCDAGRCVCLPGFVEQGNECVAEDISPLEGRSREEVCQRWQAERVSAQPEWEATPGSDDPCDAGSVPPAAQDNGLRRTNLFRWLAGLEPVGLDAGRVQAQQECAALQSAMGRLDHHPDEGRPCYTAAAAGAAGSSNLAMGGGLADSVDQFVRDDRVTSLGHRRWVLNPGALETAFGYKSRYTCMYSFSDGRRHDVEWVAWPPPGFVPADVARGEASFVAYGGTPTSFSVAVNGGPAEVVEHRALPGGYGGWGASAFAYSLPSRGVWADGAELAVVVDYRAREPVTFTIRPVSCDP